MNRGPVIASRFASRSPTRLAPPRSRILDPPLRPATSPSGRSVGSATSAATSHRYRRPGRSAHRRADHWSAAMPGRRADQRSRHDVQPSDRARRGPSTLCVPAIEARPVDGSARGESSFLRHLKQAPIGVDQPIRRALQQDPPSERGRCLPGDRGHHPLEVMSRVMQFRGELRRRVVRPSRSSASRETNCSNGSDDIRMSDPAGDVESNHPVPDRCRKPLARAWAGNVAIRRYAPPVDHRAGRCVAIRLACRSWSEPARRSPGCCPQEVDHCLPSPRRRRRGAVDRPRDSAPGPGGRR